MAEKRAEKQAGNISSGQKEILIEFLNNHSELVSAKFSSKFSHKNAQELWSEVTETLNALPGAKKTWDQWRKVLLLYNLHLLNNLQLYK